MSELDVEDIEVPLLLDAIFRRYGIDLRDYSQVQLRRLIRDRLQEENVRTVSGLQEKILRDSTCLDRLVFSLTSRPASLFDDPAFFLSLRRVVVPILATYPFVRIWHAGCPNGVDVLSMSILLEEEGLYDRCRVYVTDVSETALARARCGEFPVGFLEEWTRNYVEAGGKRALTDHCAIDAAQVTFRGSLRRNAVFAHHNLASDGSINEFNLILCRDVVPSFDGAIQNRVHDLLDQSLGRFGILGLGKNESIRSSPHASRYEELSPPQRLYRRVG